VRRALAAVTARTLFDHPTHVGTVKDLLALHLVRARHTAVMWERALENSLDEGHGATIVAMADDAEFLAGHFRDRMGLELGGLGALLEERHRILAELDARIGLGSGGFANSLEEQFAKVRDYLEPRGLEIGVAEQGQFLIGDNPAVTHNRDSGAIGLLGGATLGASDELVMPLGPRYVVGGGGNNQYLQVPISGVAHINVLQMRAAFAKVYCQPGVGLDEWALSKRDEYLTAISAEQASDDSRGDAHE
jgi:hypothetical protein